MVNYFAVYIDIPTTAQGVQVEGRGSDVKAEKMVDDEEHVNTTHSPVKKIRKRKTEALSEEGGSPRKRGKIACKSRPKHKEDPSASFIA